MCIDWLAAGAQLKELEEIGIDYLHWDITDGRFAPDFTMGSSIVNRFREESKLPSEYHLMVEEPSRLFDSFEISPNDIFTIHQECCRNLHRDLMTLRRKGVVVGVAISPGTPLDVLDYVIQDVDYVLIMTVNPGYMGQKMVPQTLRKVERLRAMLDNMKLDARIGVDGNVSFENAPKLVTAGADVLVVGSSGLFRRDMSITEAGRRLREAIAQRQAG